MDAALDLFQERGFYGTSMRDIGARSGTSVSHIYYYVPSKASVLKALMGGIVRDLLVALQAALAKAGDSPSERLASLVRAEVLFHSRRQADAFVGRSELRSLEGDDRAEVVALHDEVTKMFDAVIADGIARGEFKCQHRSEATKAVITMCNGVSSWYRPEGPLSPQTIAKRYVELALSMVGRQAQAVRPDRPD